ncbi:MAG TPA: hypothetical protein VMS89_09285 [Methanoregulaceae archaeon]|nr:hypothetical protein [Methanoregulaceae archaeon]
MFMMKTMILVILLITGLCVGTAVAIPVIPDEWYGSVFINGNPAPAGTVIVAQVNGDAAGQLTTTKEGLYGSQFGQDNLFATATEEDLNKGPVTVTFLVNGIQAFQAVRYEPGNLTKLDIYADSKAKPSSPPTLAPSSLSGAGSGVSQPSAGGFPVQSISATTPGSQVTAKTSGPIGTQTGSSGTNPDTATGQKSPAGAGNVPASTSAPVNTGSAGTLPSATTLGIVLVIVVIVLAVAYMMRKQGKI